MKMNRAMRTRARTVIGPLNHAIEMQGTLLSKRSFGRLVREWHIGPATKALFHCRRPVSETRCQDGQRR